MYVCAIVLAAGQGARFKSRTPKPLAKVNSKPIIIHCLQVISRHPAIRDIIVVANNRNAKAISRKLKQYRIGKIKGVIAGGERRQDSVLCGLKALDRRSNFVLIHDGVRPFIDKKIISALIKEARKSGAAIAAAPVKYTIKKVKGKHFVQETLERSNLWEAYTPQVFQREVILEAYRRFGRLDATDDASLVEKLGRRVSMVEDGHSNIKITTPEDLVIAEAILKLSKLV